jgi:hypothetical protein
MAAEEFNFDKWTEDNNLHRDSVKALRTNKQTDLDCLKNLKSGEMKHVGLALGQEVYLRLALARLGNQSFIDVTPGSTPATPLKTTDPEPQRDLRKDLPTSLDEAFDQDLDQHPILSAGAQLDQLFKDSPDVTRALLAPEKPAPPLASAYDPRILLSAKATTKKAEKIVSFLPEKVKDRIQRARKDRMVFTRSEDGTFSVRSNEKESFYISISEWGAANTRLMNFLLQNGDLPRDQIEYYLSYTMQVFELADTYEWTSVLLFDSRYRELQAEHGFVWGDMRLCHQMQVLIPKTTYNNRPRNSNGTRQQRSTEECKKWLATNGNCPFGNSCKYVHKRLDSAAVAKND